MQIKTEIYFSYADADESLREKLENHLGVLRRQSLITNWHRHNINAGMDKMSEIDSHLKSAQIILLLVSPDFMASDYTYGLEMMRAMERHDAGEACVIPVILRAVDYKGAIFDKLQVLPANGIPVTSWSNADEAFFDVAKGIRQAIETMNKKNSAFDSALSSHASSSNRAESEENVAHFQERSDFFDVFLSYSHQDAEWIERLARRLEDEAGFRVWLDKWMLVAGQPWQHSMAQGIDRAGCCVVCIGEHTPAGWFKREIEKALDRQTKIPSFRVIPLLLPDAKRANVDDFLELNTWVDFRNSDQAYAFHVLVCGVKGIAPRRWRPE